VVIAIIALLLSILMPALGKVREQATKVVCGTRQKQIGIAMSAYANDNKTNLPAFYVAGERRTSIGYYIANYDDAGNLVKQGQGLLLEGYGDLSTIAPKSYLSVAKMLFCPADKIRRPTQENGTGWALDPGKHPTANMTNHYYAGYHYIYLYPGNTTTDLQFKDNLKRYNTQCPGNAVIITDQIQWWSYWKSKDWYPSFHKDGGNLLKIDGSVSFIIINKIESNRFASWQSYLTFIDYQ
jgi:hypothetical protein